MSQNTVTVDSTTGGSSTTGNGYIQGHFGADFLYVGNGLIGGNVSTNGALLILSNTAFRYSTSNLFSVVANATTQAVTAAVNTFTITSNTVTITGNATVWNTLNVIGSLLINGANVNTAITGNAATAYANAVANAAALYQTTAGLSANVATLTANNSTNLNGQPSNFYTNATNISTGTIATGRLPATVNVTTLNASSLVNTAAVGVTANSLTVGTSAYVVANGNLGLANSSPAHRLSVDGSIRWTGATNENVFTISDGPSVDLNPANGTIQLWTLGASRSPTASNFVAGQSMTLMVIASSFSITWPSVSWVGGSAPLLAASGYTVIELWEVGTTIYGALVGYVA